MNEGRGEMVKKTIGMHGLWFYCGKFRERFDSGLALFMFSLQYIYIFMKGRHHSH